MIIVGALYWRLARAQISAFPVPIFGKPRTNCAKGLEISNNSDLTSQTEGICGREIDDCEGNGYGGILMSVPPTYSNVLKIKLHPPERALQSGKLTRSFWRTA
jgi:hypothetical protein